MLKVLIKGTENGKIFEKLCDIQVIYFLFVIHKCFCMHNRRGLVYMKKKELNINNSNDDKKVSHVNVLWLIYRALAENIDICTLKNKTLYKGNTEENK